jgi:hypothetical protein
MVQQNTRLRPAFVFVLSFAGACGSGASAADITADEQPTAGLPILERTMSEPTPPVDSASQPPQTVVGENPVIVVEGKRVQLHHVQP